MLDFLFFIPPDDTSASNNRILPWSSFLVICGGWLILWYLTPGLHGNGIGNLFTNNDESSIFLETIIALIIVIILIVTHKRCNQLLFHQSKWIYLYISPVVLALVLPFYYNLPLPAHLYIFWMTVSVFWQDYLTFGLLQSYLEEHLPMWTVILAVAIIFYIGHVVFIPDSFAPAHVSSAFSILGLGIVVAFLRAKLKTLHIILVLHLSFYFIVVF
ncbi:hypothetical protein [Oceanobacillus sojae]|uniref:CAAX amino protease n=1 Tax=Oceanobacillus sojae TaxID=582851 RepID=A0A511ZJB5_9BACI|nr:hypothetical protein [Oceanobacillus sojae]GEN87515.1 hypothetical protein OSO01_22540 [Oceanobacillus sojae]